MKMGVYVVCGLVGILVLDLIVFEFQDLIKYLRSKKKNER